MLETGDSEINVDRLMHEIRETVVRQRQDGGVSLSLSATPLSPLIGRQALPAQMDFSTLRLQPEFQPNSNHQYHVNDLLQYHGRDFVRNAYRAILKREPDTAGWAEHLDNLSSGRFNKIDILASLRFSPEGERAGVKLQGLTWPAAIRRMGRAPLIGYFVQLMIAFIRLPQLLQHQRQSEFHLMAQQQQLVDHDNQVHQEMAETIRQALAQAGASAERAAAQQQAIDILSKQQQEAAARQLEFTNDIETRFAATRQQVETGTAAMTQRLSTLEQQVGERIAELLQLRQQLTLQLDHATTALTEHVQQTRTLLTEQLKESAAALKIQAEESTAALTPQAEQSSSDLTQQMQERLEQLLRQQKQTRTELVMQERRLTLLLEEAREGRAAHLNQPLVQSMANEEDHLLDALYASFEDQFRGEREEVKDRLRVYLPILRRSEVTTGVLDIGCGRGEWLQLLKSEGVEARGVDRNRVFVEECRQSGLDVSEEDALLYLRDLPDNSLSAISSFHLVEHLPFETLIKLLDECVRVLKPEGLLILETPNPENFIVGSCTFYADPTHRNPIPSQTLSFLLEARGLFRIEVLKLRPWETAKIEGETEIIKRFNEYFYGAPDYGIVGWKA
jgi:O-antigen chain-terminating methyltransferase